MADDGSSRSTAARERGNRGLRFLDRFLGIPLLRLLGFVHRKRPGPVQVRRIALLKTAAIGDTVLISAIVGDLRRAWPQVWITFFCGASNHGAAKLLDGVDEVLCLPVARPLLAVRTMRGRGGFDVLIDFGQWPRLDALLAGLGGSRFSIGFQTAGQYRHYLYDAAVLHRSDRHEIENFRALLGPLAIPTGSSPRIACSSPAGESKRVVLHLFAGGLRAGQKEWPAENWLELIDHLLADGFSPVLTGSPENRRQALDLAARTRYPERVRVTAGELDLPGLIELLAGAALLITVNTGVMHLAAALDRPLIALNGPTSVLRWGPLSARAIVLRSPRPCSPCLNLGFEYACPGNACMQELTVESVLAAYDAIRSGRQL